MFSDGVVGTVDSDVEPGGASWPSDCWVRSIRQGTLHLVPKAAREVYCLVLHGLWLLAAEWNLELPHDQLAERLRKRHGDSLADQYLEQVKGFERTVGGGAGPTRPN